jgi:hypothetical protein
MHPPCSTLHATWPVAGWVSPAQKPFATSLAAPPRSPQIPTPALHSCMRTFPAPSLRHGPCSSRPWLHGPARLEFSRRRGLTRASDGSTCLRHQPGDGLNPLCVALLPFPLRGQLEAGGEWEDGVDAVVALFQQETGRRLTYAICYY